LIERREALGVGAMVIGNYVLESIIVTGMKPLLRRRLWVSRDHIHRVCAYCCMMASAYVSARTSGPGCPIGNSIARNNCGDTHGGAGLEGRL
jgi:hypothetical protein